MGSLSLIYKTKVLTAALHSSLAERKSNHCFWAKRTEGLFRLRGRLDKPLSAFLIHKQNPRTNPPIMIARSTIFISNTVVLACEKTLEAEAEGTTYLGLECNCHCLPQSALMLMSGQVHRRPPRRNPATPLKAKLCCKTCLIFTKTSQRRT